MRLFRYPLLRVCGCLLFFLPQLTESGELEIKRLKTDSPSGDESGYIFLVTGLAEDQLEAVRNVNWTVEDWQRMFSITVHTDSQSLQFQMPPIAGTYGVFPDGLRFEPRFPLTHGLKCKVVFRPGLLPIESDEKPLAKWFEAPRPVLEPSASVQGIYPTSSLLPENLLKFYLHFSDSMSGGGVYEHIELLDEDGVAVDLPFLEIDEELWDPEMTRLTLFIDPGRIKRGVKPLEDIGPSLLEGREYTLRISSNWLDARGVRLKSGFEKRFKVGPPDREPPDPSNWRLKIPPSHGTEPLSIDLGEAMDHALALRMIHLIDGWGKELDGDVFLENNESTWVFRPKRPWKEGNYHLLIETHIEDLAGNNIGKPFEVDLFGQPQKQLTASTVSLGFKVF